MLEDVLQAEIKWFEMEIGIQMKERILGTGECIKDKIFIPIKTDSIIH